MNVRDVMTRNPRTVAPNDTIQRAATVMKEVDTGFVPIVENGKVVGVVTDRDIVIRAVAAGSYDKPVSEIATRDLVFVSPNATTREAEKLMESRQELLEHYRARLEVAIRNPGLRSATVLDMNGMAVRTVPLTAAAGEVRFSFPDSAMYVVLR